MASPRSLFRLASSARAYSCKECRRRMATVTTDRVHVVEVGPRDGLQNEKTTIPLETKSELIGRLAQTGLRTIEAGSFVSPKWVPQMANSSEILETLLQRAPSAPEPITYQFLVPNSKGLDNFLAVYNKTRGWSNKSSTKGESEDFEVSIFTAATETFTQKNTNCSIAESLERFKPVFAAAKANDVRVRAYISVALGCPYEGPDVDPRKVADIAVSLLELGADEISVADTTGMGTVPRTRKLMKTLAGAGIEAQDLALHFHDTYGQALANTIVGLEAGVRTFDAAVSGLGGCPYSPGATGNIATEEMVYLCESLGLSTGVNLPSLAETGDWISRSVGRPNESRVGKATLARLKRKKD